MQGEGVSLSTHGHSLLSGVGSLVPSGCLSFFGKPSSQGGHPASREGGQGTRTRGRRASLVFKSLVIKIIIIITPKPHECYRSHIF